MFAARPPRIASRGSARRHVAPSCGMPTKFDQCDGREHTRGVHPMTWLSGCQLPISQMLHEACLPGDAPPHADLVLQCQHDQVSVLRSIKGCSARRQRSISIEPSVGRTDDVDSCQRSSTARLKFGSCTGQAAADGRLSTTTRLSCSDVSVGRSSDMIEEEKVSP